MKYLYILLLVPFFAFAQQNIQKCAFDELMEKLEKEHPGYKSQIDATFQNAKTHGERNRNSRSDEPVYQIPIVVHMLYTNSNDSLSDETILDQIQLLNEDWRRLNPDTNLTRDIFKDIAVDTRIEFYLAPLDPQGNATEGITRTQTNAAPFFPFGQEDMKRGTDGGKDPWPTDRYLNIWVCQMDFGVLGYAYPPTGAPNWSSNNFADSANQGVVVDIRYFNGRNTSNDPSFFGRTLTHEVGHYLGLRHYWGDGNCNSDDGIDDTPPASSNANFGCDYDKNTCNQDTFPDMIENYMDYADESCYNMFSAGQVELMRSMVELYRFDLTEPLLKIGAVEDNVTVVGLNRHAIDVQANDTILEFASITSITQTSGRRGTIEDLGAGYGFYFTPAELGTYTFDYEICYEDFPDICDEASVTVRVNDVNTSITNRVQNLNIYPNPSKGILNLGSGGADIESYMVLNQAGAIVHERKNINRKVKQITLNDKLQNGLYILVIETKGQTQTSLFELSR